MHDFILPISQVSVAINSTLCPKTLLKTLLFCIFVYQSDIYIYDYNKNPNQTTSCRILLRKVLRWQHRSPRPISPPNRNVLHHLGPARQATRENSRRYWQPRNSTPLFQPRNHTNKRQSRLPQKSESLQLSQRHIRQNYRSQNRSIYVSRNTRTFRDQQTQIRITLQRHRPHVYEQILHRLSHRRHVSQEPSTLERTIG